MEAMLSLYRWRNWKAERL